MMSLMVQPPQPGDESYPQFHEEENGIFESLRRRADALVQGLNKIDGIECQVRPVNVCAFLYTSKHVLIFGLFEQIADSRSNVRVSISKDAAKGH
jgi:aspartate/methionine/tyrosine aminotransferase